MEKLRKEYNELLAQYGKVVSSRMAAEDLRSYNEVLFSAHSCGIEGNSFTVNDTRSLKEQGLGLIPCGKPLVEAFEMLDHFRAYEYMFQTANEPLTEQYVKHIHFLLTEHTIAYRHQGAVPGEYTDVDMCAGDTLFGDHTQLIAQVPQLLESTERALSAQHVEPIEMAAMFHGFFEHLHPFRDGNGRIGRLLANKILLRFDQPIVIIRVEDKAEYIECLKLFARESKEYLISFFYKVAIRRLRTEIEAKQRNTTLFSMFF